MANFPLFFFSGVVAFCSYILILLALYTQFLDLKNPIEYAANKETAFEIALLEEKKEIIQPKPAIKQETMPQKENRSPTPNPGLGVFELFSHVDVPKPITKQEPKPPSINPQITNKKKGKEEIKKETPKKEEPPNVPQDTLSDELQKIISGIELKKTMSFAIQDAQYNEFYAKIHEILSSHWNPIFSSVLAEAKVLITIDNQGRFSYQIIKLSGDFQFDEALKEFLDIMVLKEFPKFEGGSKTTIEVTFKTEG